MYSVHLYIRYFPTAFSLMVSHEPVIKGNSWNDQVLPLNFDEHEGVIDGVKTIEQNSVRIKSWLILLESKMEGASLEERIAFSDLFSDAVYKNKRGRSEINQIRPDKILQFQKGIDDRIRDVLEIAYYRALYNFLLVNDRYKEYSASFVCLHACFKWYNLLKILLHNEEYCKQPDLRNEMATAFLEFNAALGRSESDSSGALHLLVDNDKNTGCSDDIEERLHLQMLMFSDQSDNNRSVLTPIDLFTKIIQWDKKNSSTEFCIRFHPVFNPFVKKMEQRSKRAATSTPQSKAAVRMIASERSLKNYDFETTLRLANMTSGRRINCHGLPLWLILFVFTTGILSAVSICATKGFTDLNNLFTLQYLTIYAGIAVIFFVLLFFLDKRVLIRLFLPRLIGGISIGFSLLALEESTAMIYPFLWSFPPLIKTLLLCAVTLFSFLYIYTDIRPRVREKNEALRRSIQSFFIFTLFSLIIGSIILSFPTAKFQSILTTPPNGFFFGPLGWVDINLWITFSPIALFLGIITQFLFEEKTITASVWPMEKE